MGTPRLTARLSALGLLALVAAAPALGQQRSPDTPPLVDRGGIEGDPIRIDAVDPDVAPFLWQMKRQIIAKWGYPCLRDPESGRCEYLPARVVINVGVLSTGALQFTEVTTSSGYTIYDDAALAAIRRAAPFTEVPAEMMARMKPGSTGAIVRILFTYSVSDQLGLPGTAGRPNTPIAR